MTPERWSRIEQLFHQALQVEPCERDAFITKAAGSDPLLIAEVGALLRNVSRARDFLENPAVELFGGERPNLPHPERIGPYRVAQLVGHGGMGDVYHAVRGDDEYRKEVAIKLIRRGLDTDSVVRRFRRERQILANLDHPNITRLLDGGTTEDGLPYLVMEYVEGRPIVEFCRERASPVSDRLRLFQAVCGAVHYAHQRLVVHLDIKPANILVTAGGVPKLLDFGIARLLDSTTESGDTTLLRPLTPEYASPEQIRGDTATSASDVYSLGVLLYELLSGTRPFSFSGLPPHEAARIADETTPAPPSAVAVNGKLRHALVSDLDNIVLMALRKDPQRRYASAAQLSEDIERFLKGAPVFATRDTVLYRSAKFFRRHKAAALASLLFVFALIGGLLSTAWQWKTAREQRSQAQAARALAERHLNEFLSLAHSLLFDYQDKLAGLNGSTAVRSALVRDTLGYLDQLARDSNGSAVLQGHLAAAYLKIGDVQGRPYSANLGDTAGALNSYRRALALLKPLTAANPRDEELRLGLSDTYDAIGRLLTRADEPAEALGDLREALAIRLRLVGTYPQDERYRRKLAASWIALGDPFLYGGQISGALGAYSNAQEILGELSSGNPSDLSLRREWGSSRQRLGSAYSSIGSILDGLGDPAHAGQAWKKALEYYRSAAAIADGLVRSDPHRAEFRRTLADTGTDVARTLRDLGDLSGALALQSKSVAVFKSLCKADDANQEARFDLLLAQNGMAGLLARSGQIQSALRIYRSNIAAGRVLASRDPDNKEVRRFLVSSYTEVCGLLESSGDLVSALENANAILQLDSRFTGAFSRSRSSQVLIAWDLTQISRLLAKFGRTAEAHASAARALGIARRIADRAEASPEDWAAYAQTLLDCSDKDLRNVPIAIAYLERAVASAPAADVHFLRSLARAYYIRGDLPAAAATAAKIASLIPYPRDVSSPLTVDRFLHALEAEAKR